MCIRDRLPNHPLVSTLLIHIKYSHELEEPYEYVESALRNIVRLMAEGYLQKGGVDRLMKTHRRLRIILLPCMAVSTYHQTVITRAVAAVITSGNLPSIYNIIKKINHWVSLD